MGIIHFVKNSVCKTEFGKRMVNIVRIRNLDEKFYNFFVILRYCYEAKHPTNQMKLTKKYFFENKERIEKNVNLLADETSKECYTLAIKYRYTHNRKDEPKYTKIKYFPQDLISIGEDDVLLDGGAFVGDTVKSFNKISKGNYKKIICFEPDTFNYEMLNYIRSKKISKYNLGLWNKSETLSFFNNMSVGSKVVNCEHGSNITKIPVVAIDDIPECRDATIVKLDIEGAEYKALEGAKNLISDRHPTLVVCLYHSNEDMIRLIEYVHELDPSAKLYVRSHSHLDVETVLYAIH